MNALNDDSSLRQLMMTSETTEHDSTELLPTANTKETRLENEEDDTIASPTKLSMDQLQDPQQENKICTKEASHAVAVAAVAAVLSHGLLPIMDNQKPPTPTNQANENEEEKQPLNAEQTTVVRIAEPTWKVIARTAAPHLGLLLLSLIYTFIGAAVFIRLEEPHAREQQRDRSLKIRENREELLSNLYQLSRAGRPIEEGEEEFHRFALRLHSLHQPGKWREEDDETQLATRWMDEWNFGAAVFFVFTTLTTIGYGNVVPATQAGRIFCMCYGLIGVPLLLVTTADIAKFMSSGLTRLYIHYLKWKAKAVDKISRLIFRRKSHELDVEDTESMAEYVWNNVDSVHYVKIHGGIILVIILAYTSMGGWLFSRYEQWTFFEAFYFSFISILKVGFGDVLPANRSYSWLSMLYIFFGLTVATMCVDIAGSQYLERIHQLGRQMKSADYLSVIQRAKYRRKRREAMKSLMTVLTLVNRMHFPPGTLLRKEMEELKLPPPPPTEVRVTNITPYSIKLIWTRPNPSSKAKYVLKYKMKHSKSESTVNISNICEGEIEIKNLKSFSIYEISLSSVNRVGRSNSVRLIQITEPETSPQDLAVEVLGPTSVSLTWKPPYKKQKDVKKYAIYYSSDAEQPFERWTKIIVDATDHKLRLDDLVEGASQYAFCISSVYDRGHSPISRAVYAASVSSSRKTSTVTGVSGYTSSSVRDENANSSYAAAAIRKQSSTLTVDTHTRIPVDVSL